MIDELALGAGASVLVGAGDIARCDALEPAFVTAALVEAIVEGAGSAFVFTTGDHAYERGTRQEFEQCYSPSWGRFEEITRPSPGNHDYDSEGAAPFYAYFSHFSRNPAARERGFYSYQLAGWHIVALNSVISMAEDSPQIEWLEADLEEADAECILAYWHHPLFSSGLRSLNPWYSGRDTKPAWEVLSDFDADIVVNGHEHFYERYAPQDSSGNLVSNGIPQFTVGTGGGELQSFALHRANRAVIYREGYGVLVLVLGADRFDYAFVGTDGSIHDRSDGSISCDD